MIETIEDFYKHGNSMKGQINKMAMTVTSAITNEPIEIDPREVNALAVSYHSNDLGFIRMESGKTWIVKEKLATLARIYADAIKEA